MKLAIDRAALKEKVTHGEIIRSFLNYAFEAYEAGNVHRLWGETMMEHFRKQVEIGHEIIAAGIVGTVKDKKGLFLVLEISPGIEIKIVQSKMTDILNPSKDLILKM